MVYPSLIAAVSDASHPTWRARSLSAYRFWRDLRYAIAALTFLSGFVVAFVMHKPDLARTRTESHPSSRRTI